MVSVKEQYPFIDEEGKTYAGLVRHWAEDENGKRYLIKQIETGTEYSEAVDLYPCRYTYEATDKPEDAEE